MSSFAHPHDPTPVDLPIDPRIDPPVGSADGSRSSAPDDALTIDCDRCTARGAGCADCVVSVLLGGPPDGVALDDTELHAIDVLARAGLVPPLRMVEPVDTPDLNA